MRKKKPKLPIAGNTERESQPRPYKIQRPLAHSGPFEYLIYSRDRKVNYTMPGPDAALDQFMGGFPKIYILAHFTTEGKIVIHHLLPDQGF